MRVLLLFAIFLSSLTMPAWADKKPSGPLYPPYPEVWGQELSPGVGRPWLLGIPQDNGDIGLLYGTKVKVPADRLRGFFSGHDTELTSATFEMQERQAWDKKYTQSHNEPFDDFSSRQDLLLFEDKASKASIWRTGFDYHLAKTEDIFVQAHMIANTRWSCLLGSSFYALYKDNRVVGYKVIVRRRPETVTVPVGKGVVWVTDKARLYYDECHKNLPYSDYRTRVAIWRLTSHPRLVLKDGTFLAVVHSTLRADGGADEWNERVVVRMRPDFSSPYLDQRGDVHVLDFAQIEPILKESEQRATADPSFNDAEFIFGRIGDLIDSLPPKAAPAGKQ